ncbi:MAG: ribosome biogenesis GTPase Der [Thermodesulfobacteriota bacterium]
MARQKAKLLVALVGRPNVGKSTMFNRLVGSRKALVEDTPGLTRDRNYAEVNLRDRTFLVVDTGGFEPDTDDVMLSQMRTQTMVAIEEADLIVFLGDGKAGLTPSDREIVRTLAQTEKPVFHAINKIDSEKQEDAAVDFYAMGLEKIYPVSARTGFGLDDLLDALCEKIPLPPDSDAEKPYAPSAARIAVVGRPNVGKSTLINLLLGEERLVANPKPGTTRDSIDTVVRHYGKEYLLIDTAGIRRKSRIVDKLEKYSVIKAFGSIDRAQIVLLMLDSTELVTDQDARIAGYAFEKAKGIIILLNKWDLVPKDSKTHGAYVEKVRTALKYVDHAPILTISATEGTRAVKIFSLIETLYQEYSKRIGTSALNDFLERVKERHPPGTHRGNKLIKIYYMTQVRTSPPSFAFFCNYPEAIHFSYRRFLENQLRETFAFGGSPLRLFFRKREGKELPRGRHRPARK